MAKIPSLASAKADAKTPKIRCGVTAFGDLVDLHLTIEIVHDRRRGELLRIKPTPPPTPASASDSEPEADTSSAQESST